MTPRLATLIGQTLGLIILTAGAATLLGVVLGLVIRVARSVGGL